MAAATATAASSGLFSTPFLPQKNSTPLQCLTNSSFLLLCNSPTRRFNLPKSSPSKTALIITARAAASVNFSVPHSNASETWFGRDHLDISKLGICDEVVSALSRRGITQLFPIQRAVLEPAMEGRDMIGRAITGSGKTLAFGIPILDKIIRNQHQHRRKRVPSALILAPTRELARQVQKEFKESAPILSSACLYGGIPIMNQVRVLGFGIDIAVGTPGRIIDLIERGALDLSEVKFVVLDEADQMLAVGFQEDVECILSYLPADRQSMLFSATMPSWVNDLSRKYLRDPLVIDLVRDSDQKLAEGISLYSVISTAHMKQSILPNLISKYGQGGKCIIFTKTKKDAEMLSRAMSNILRCRALHGNMQQLQRDRTLTAFRDGRFHVLVATDVAARGLDIPNVELVIHLDLPNTPEIFVHRSGRTGRAGKKGTAVLIYTGGQRRAVRLIEKDLGFKFEELPQITDGVGNRSRTVDVEDSYYDGMRTDSASRSLRHYQQSQGYPLDEARAGRSYYNDFKTSKGKGDFSGYGSSDETHFYGNQGVRGARRGTRSGRDQFGSYGNIGRGNRLGAKKGMEADKDSFGAHLRSRDGFGTEQLQLQQCHPW